MTDFTSLPDLSVNEILRRWPASVGALNAHGVDTCCGGASSLAEAAADIGVPVSTLVDAIARSIARSIAAEAVR